ncbi:MAG: flavoprotein [Endomicrobiales bacterium]|jgi:phosphopantothenoylcysteine synthetase/decarboxylase
MSREKESKHIILGICGGIAAYKMPDLIRLLRAECMDVTCVLSENGARFVTPLTVQTLSRNRVYEGMFDPSDWDIEHIALADKADIVVVAPATADTLARLAAGRADNLLSSVILATQAPIVVCPAMNEKMWVHPATQHNVAVLKKFGYRFIEPESGELACGVSGVGRLASLDIIVKTIKEIVSR